MKRLITVRATLVEKVLTIVLAAFFFEGGFHAMTEVTQGDRTQAGELYRKYSNLVRGSTKYLCSVGLSAGTDIRPGRLFVDH